MRWGIDQWLITDTFRREWRFWIAPSDALARGAHVSRWDMVGEPLFHILPQAFSEWGAREDEAASDLLAIYDALTGSHWSEQLPRPTVDRRRQLRGFAQELSRVLYGALEAGVLKFERYEIPWPFPDIEEKPEEPAREAPVEEQTATLWVRLDIDPDDASNHDDQFRLTSTDGSYTQTKTVAQDKVPNDRSIDLEYTDLSREKQYSLQVIPARGSPYYVFRNTAYSALNGVSGAGETPYQAGPHDPHPDEVGP